MQCCQTRGVVASSRARARIKSGHIARKFIRTERAATSGRESTARGSENYGSQVNSRLVYICAISICVNIWRMFIIFVFAFRLVSKYTVDLLPPALRGSAIGRHGCFSIVTYAHANGACRYSRGRISYIRDHFQFISRRALSPITRFSSNLFPEMNSRRYVKYSFQHRSRSPPRIELRGVVEIRSEFNQSKRRNLLKTQS